MARPESVGSRLLQAYWSACFHPFLLMFGIGIWLVNLACVLSKPVLPRAATRAALLRFIHLLTGFYLALMERSGALRTNRRVLDGIADANAGLLIVANHPSMLDAPIFLSRIPGLLCVFKSALKQSLLMPLTARSVGYLSNDDGVQMLRDLEALLKSGARVLVFPEGTRTAGPVLDRLNPGYALAAQRAGVPVQVVAIRCASPILTKRQHFLRGGRFPVGFELSPGPRIEPGTFHTVQQLNACVETWLRASLSGPQPLARGHLPPGVVIEAGESLVSGRLRVPADPFHCRGHMPGRPLVPAYAQLAWTREILEVGTATPATAIHYHRWKFLLPVGPGDALNFKAVLTGGAWRFTFTRGTEKVTQGLATPRGKEDGQP